MSHIQDNFVINVAVAVAVVIINVVAAAAAAAVFDGGYTFINHMVQYQCFNTLHCKFRRARAHKVAPLNALHEILLKRKYSLKLNFLYTSQNVRSMKKTQQQQQIISLSFLILLLFASSSFFCFVRL